ncbi:hypothetical protein PWY87_24460 [Kribbella solani]|uniref:N,N-dimethylformamidase beta subunit family domain-containing protein n=1 Tax=Kribbella solani TaxID=236067 RepID=UPI0029A677A9|nr:N,N-dimethylformamidase beta subunit family domain-containing protein [Kribbella solani]MDX3004859.1 hypothetical protein [Kribbella solani]
MPKYPPTRSVQLAGYPDVWVTRPGSTVNVHVDSENASFRASLVRLDGGISAGRPVTSLVREAGAHQGLRQQTSTGSYVLVPRAADALRSRNFTIRASLWPTLPGNGSAQTVLSRADENASIALRLDGLGRLELVFSTPEASLRLRCDHRLAAKRWYHVEASLDGDQREARLYYEPAHNSATRESVRRTFDVPLARPGDQAPLMIGALRQRDVFEGKIEAPQVWREVVHGHPGRGELVAAWDFAVRPESTYVHDSGLAGLHGRTVNGPTRLVTGHAWSGTEVDPRHAPGTYAAVHFHSDDLEDASWRPTFGVDLPDDLASGVYAVELASADDRRWIPFTVAPRRPTSRVAVILPTYTYLAYANFRITDRAAELAAQLRGLDEAELFPEERYILEHPELGLSMYDTHLDGSPTCYSSRLRPVMEMSPLYRYSSSGAPRHLSADLELLGWLRRRGQSPDVLTDECLHTTGARLLEPYQVVITGSHPEYCTASMRDALRRYVARGGRLMYLGGNGFYWVTSTSSERAHVIEVRRGQAGTRTGDSPAGEVHHSLTGEPGGLWRHRGHPPESLVGVGFAGLGYGSGAGYRQLPHARASRFSYALDGVPQDAVIGDFGPTGGAVDDEFDHVPIDQPAPAETVVIATSKGNHRSGYYRCIDDVRQLAPDVMQSDDVGADLALTDWQGGGITFATGSIGWTNCLSHENDANTVSTVTENVLRAFLRRGAPDRT